ncbi:MAG: flippase-like domain-containing protein [Rhodospirillales bacterium]|nr:flippase-like domain-containing protein [Rhodospirillales bacterium]MDE2198153.1 flippase-like domain-containing protein [Rhodospirillales bacterium]
MKRSLHISLGLLAITMGGGVAIALVLWYGVRGIGGEVIAAAWVVAPGTALLFGQLYLSAIAWRLACGVAQPSTGAFLMARWVREAVNSLLPVAQLGGNVVGVRLLARRGLAGALGALGTILDLTVEAGTQLVFTLEGAGLLLLYGLHVPPWLSWALLPVALGLAGFILAQRIGLMRLVAWLAGRLAGMFPALTASTLGDLHGDLRRLQGNRGALRRALALHLLTWHLGIAETWLALAALGHPAPFAQAFAVESLGMAARSAGFAVPGALGVQEAGFILACGLFAIPPDIAIALSVLKRLRELTVGVPGLLAWQWSEGRHWLRRARAIPAAAAPAPSKAPEAPP